MAACLDTWILRGVVSPHAALPCSSLQHPASPTLSTACDGLVECHHREDEAACQQGSLQTFIQIGTVTLMLTIYVVLKFRKDRKEKNPTFSTFEAKPLKLILRKFRTKRQDPGVVAEVNTYLFYVVYCKPTDEAKEIYKQFYELEANIHNGVEQKIFHSLHQHLHPLLVDCIVEATFPGLTQCCIDCLEAVFCSRFITRLQDLVTRTPLLGDLLVTLWTMVKITSNYVDIFKDTYLTVSLLQLVGGPGALLLYPAHFSSVVVLGLAASILVPLAASSLHLAANQPGLLVTLPARRSVVTAVCLGTSVLIPIFLINCYEREKDKIRKMVRTNCQDSRVMKAVQKGHIIKTQLVEFFRIELGNCILNIYIFWTYFGSNYENI